MSRRALVLGGGLAGLAAAVHLAVAGAEVTLLEARPELGGKAGEWRAGGYRFDTGPSVLTLPEVVEATFRAAGRTCPVRLEPLDPLCRYRFPSGRVLDVHRDLDRTLAGLTPAEGRAYRRLLAQARRLYEAAAPTFLYGPAPGPLALARYALRHGPASRPGRTLAGLVARTEGVTPDLERLFLRFATYLGADPYRAPAVLHNVAWAELGLGVVRARGGVRAIVAALAELAGELGVELRSGEPVTAIERSGGRVVGARTARGGYRAEAVVSALDRVRTQRLLGIAAPRGRFEPSLSGLVLLLGVAGETPELAHHTVLFPADYRAEHSALRVGRMPDDGTLYVGVSARSDPADAPPGAENWVVLANAPALPEGLPPEAAEADEAAEAARLERRLVELGLLEPSRVRVRHRLGPSHLARLAHRGAIYGRAPHSLGAALRPGHRLRGARGLALAGGTVHPGGGVPLALLSGREAARLAIGDLALPPLPPSPPAVNG